MNYRVRSLTASLGALTLLVALPAAVATIETPGISRADVCADAGGRHVDVGGCTEPLAPVDAPPPPQDVPPPPPPPENVPPPPPPPGPEVNACVDAGGRHVDVAGCN
jgi:hypothetical protein